MLYHFKYFNIIFDGNVQRNWRKKYTYLPGLDVVESPLCHAIMDRHAETSRDIRLLNILLFIYGLR